MDPKAGEAETKDQKVWKDPDTGEEISKNEYKRRMKAKEKEQKDKEKASKKKGDAAEKKGDAKDKGGFAFEDDETNPAAYTENRKKWLQDVREGGENPYPHKFQRTHRIDQFIEEFSEKTKVNEFLDDAPVSVTGRVNMIRAAGPKLIFIDLTGDNKKVQVMANAKLYADADRFAQDHMHIRRGDIVGVHGVPGRTKTDELTVRATQTIMLSYCLHMVPKKKKEGPGGEKEEVEKVAEGESEHKDEGYLLNKDTRYRQRYLDLICHPFIKDKFQTRSKIISYIRNFLIQRDFVEVETPMMNMIAGGATARPFETFHNELDMKLFMRIAPELYLKMLIVGGMDRVFEIGKQFRNEGIDLTHNPEFTTCEFYWAYCDYNDLMAFTEQMLSSLVHSLFGSYKVSYHPNGPEEPGNVVEVDFTPPFRRIPMIEGLQEALGVQFPADLASEEAHAFFDKLCVERDVDCSHPRTTARLIDKLVGEYLESQCLNPTYIIDHPQLMSPLAKYHRKTAGLTERFELFIHYHEFVNAYTELNDPKVQFEAFSEQVKQKDAGDLEAQEVDHGFVKALEYGLPPTAGWGLGIDRLTMLLTDSNNIKEVMLFPAMKPKV